MKIVNEQGLKQIRDYLFDLHKKEIFTATEVSYFAADIEDSLDAGNPAEFEIKASDSKSGHVELCRLDDECFDVEEFDNSLNDYHNYRKSHDCKRSGCTVCVAFEH